MPVDIGSIKRNDQIAGAAAILAFIFALIPGVRTIEAKGGFKAALESSGESTSDSANLWHGLGVLAALLLIVGIAGLVAAILNRAELRSLPVRWITTAVWGLTSLFVLIFMLTYKGDTNGVPDAELDKAVNFGAGIVGWILLLLCLVATVFAALGAQESGEKLPWQGQQTAGPEATPPPAA
jgi:hypothetical protein